MTWQSDFTKKSCVCCSKRARPSDQWLHSKSLGDNDYCISILPLGSGKADGVGAGTAVSGRRLSTAKKETDL